MLARLSKLKAMLLIDALDSSLDDQLNLCLATASTAIEDHCRRSFEKKSYTDQRSGTQSKYIALRNYPVDGEPVVLADALPITDFVKLDDGLLFRGVGWPRGEYNLTINYTGGYVLPSDVEGAPESTLPKPIEMACLTLSKMMYTGEWGKTEERIGPYSAKFLTNEGNQLPPVVAALIAPYVGRFC